MEHRERMERMALLTIAVSAEISRDRCDSAYADEVRECMDPLFDHGSSEQQDQLRGLCVDLTWVFEPEFAQVSATRTDVTRAQVLAAADAQDWPQVLNLLRHLRDPLVPAPVRLGLLAKAYHHLVAPWLGDLFRGASVRLQEAR